MKTLRILCLILICSFTSFGQNNSSLIIRCDDIGMCHAVNQAVSQLAESNLRFSASVMFTCPWWEEAAAILKKYPDVSIGVHLTLNAEWMNYRWGPAAGWKTVPSLTDSNGYFLPSRSKYFANKPKLNEVETELRAQIERAMNSGLKIDYLDYHMGTAVSTPEYRAIVEKLAKEFNLGISRYFGETDITGDSTDKYKEVYFAPPDEKIKTAISLLKKIKNGDKKLLVMHIGLISPEMDALIDLNPNGLKDMSKYRQGELNVLLSPEFRKTINEQGIKILTYKDLLKDPGAGKMKRP
jgi:chitin disaccharide deacetylase